MYPGLFIQLTCVLVWITVSITQYCVMMKVHAGKNPTIYYQVEKRKPKHLCDFLFVALCSW